MIQTPKEVIMECWNHRDCATLKQHLTLCRNSKKIGMNYTMEPNYAEMIRKNTRANYKDSYNKSMDNMVPFELK